MSSSPAKKKARLSGEETTLRPPRQPANRPPPSVEARKRRQLAIAAALSQPENGSYSLQPVSVSTSSTSAESLLVRDGLTNATNLLLTPKRDPPDQLRKDDFTAMSTVQASIRVLQNDEKDVFGTSQASAAASTHESTARTVHDAHANGDRAEALKSPILSPASAPLREASPLDEYHSPVTPPPSKITCVEPGVFFTASHRRMELSSSALAEARQFTSRVDQDLPPEVDPDDEMAVISAMKTSHFQLSQSVRKPSIPFHPPLRRLIQAKETPSTPVRPPLQNSQSTSLQPFSPGSQTPIRSVAHMSHMSSTPVTGVVRPIAAFPTPVASSQRSLGMTARRNGTPINKPFVTPFKTGFGPGSSTPQPKVTSRPTRPSKGPVPAASVRPQSYPALVAPASTPSVVRRDETPWASACFDTRKEKSKLSMKDFGLIPGAYSVRDLLDRGVPAEIPSINVANAAGYSFYTGKSDQRVVLGCNSALEHLHSRGCTLATADWVEVHWSLILWKRASIICCKPDLLESSWTFENICEGLMYHYERDLNRIQRPILRLILERDATPARPMVLVVSSIRWAPQEMDEDGHAILLPHPTLELTDGWYLVRAEVDQALARAARRRKIRLGTKLVVAGAKLDANGEPKEVLKAYDESTLIISGNSTTLARWDAKLGPLLHDVRGKSERCIISPVASLRSLTPDGGLTMMVDIVIEKLHPVGFIETLVDGTRLPPVNEAENRAAEASWERERFACLDEEKEKLDNALSYLASFSSKAQSLSKGCTPGPDDDEPDQIDGIVEDLEDADDGNGFFKGLRLSPTEYSWLARRIDKRVEERRTDAAHLVEANVKERWPPRSVSNFRTIIVRDALPSMKYTTERTAQLTMWNVLSLGPEFLVEGRRYMVSNVIPSNASSWVGHREDGEIILKSTNATRWRAIR